MKKMIALILSFVFGVGLLAACGEIRTPADMPVSENSSQPTGTSPAETETPAPAPAESGDQTYGGDRFVGEWSDEVSQRAALTIIPTEEFGVYNVRLHWSDTAASFVEWEMTAAYDDSSDSIRYTDGSRCYVTLHEDADEERTPDWEASEGRFFFEGDRLCWEDDKEKSDEGVRFVRITTYAPGVSELLDSFFRPVAGIPNGTPGAMLKQAQVACDALRFANTNAVWCNDPGELRAHLAEAWAGLTAVEQVAFEENLFAVHGLIVNSVVDWENYGYLFEDAGIAEDMQALESDRTALESFSRLFDHTVAVCLAGEDGD